MGIDRRLRAAGELGAFRNTGLNIVRTDGSTVHASLYSAGPLNRPGFADATIGQLEQLRARYTVDDH